MKIKRIFPVVWFLILSALISACTGVAMNTSWPGVSATTDMAYASNGPEVYAIKLSDGTMSWRFPDKADPAKPFFADPVLTQDGQLLVGDYGNNGTLHSLDPKTGKELWQFSETKGRLVAPPLVVNDTIYAPCADGILYVLSLQGKLQWKFTAKNAFWSQPVADTQNVYVTSMDRNLYALNISAHRQAWSVNLGASAVSSPALGKDGTLYVGTLGNELLAIRPDNGKILWRMATTSGVWGAPVYNDGSLYFGDYSGNVYSYTVSADSGKLNWTFASGSPISGSPIILKDGLAVITQAGALTGISFDGKLKPTWTKPETGKYFGSPILAGDGMLLMAATESEFFVYAFAPDGSQAWSFKPPK